MFACSQKFSGFFHCQKISESGGSQKISTGRNCYKVSTMGKLCLVLTLHVPVPA